IDQHGHLALRCNRLRSTCGDGLLVSHVEAFDHQRLAAQRHDFIGNRLKRSGPPPGQRHRKTPASQRQSYRAADACARPGDEGMLPAHFRPAASAAARARLFSYCERADRYCFGHSTPEKPIFAASCRTKDGSARCGRATAHRSARPAAITELAWSASEIAPTAMVATSTSLRTLA